MNFSLDQLIALESIARNGTFAAAAKEIHRVPSAVSYLISNLEDTLEVSLFDRTGRKAVLTPAGDRILEQAKEVLDASRTLQHMAAELAKGWEVELHVVVDGSLPMQPLSTCLARFADPAIPTRLRVDVEHQDGVNYRLNGGADIGIVHAFDFDGDEVGYDRIPFGKLRMDLVAVADHPLHDEPMSGPFDQRYSELVVRDSSPQYDERSRPSFMGSRNVLFLSDFHSKRLALLSGAGFGWIPRHLIEEDLQEGTLKPLPAEPNYWVYEPYVITRRGAPLGRGAQLFIDTLKDNYVE
jgi:DNA-binding transcriptional LysR family regulator